MTTGSQLLGISHENQPLNPWHDGPDGGLHGLGGLIHHGRASYTDTAGKARETAQRAAQHIGSLHSVVLRALLDFADLAPQRPHFSIVTRLPQPAELAVHAGQGLAVGPRGQGLLQSKRPHLSAHACEHPEPEHPESPAV